IEWFIRSSELGRRCQSPAGRRRRATGRNATGNERRGAGLSGRKGGRPRSQRDYERCLAARSQVLVVTCDRSLVPVVEPEVEDGLRNGLVDELASAGVIHSPSVERAFRRVPRHAFLEEFWLPPSDAPRRLDRLERHTIATQEPGRSVVSR